MAFIGQNCIGFLFCGGESSAGSAIVKWLSQNFARRAMSSSRSEAVVARTQGSIVAQDQSGRHGLSVQTEPFGALERHDVSQANGLG
jgi:hypothetical protein